jgi:hypothetical protein
MPRYEILQIKTPPSRVDTIVHDYSFFGWERIGRDEFKNLQQNPVEPDKAEEQITSETVKTNQTIYPDSSSFMDLGSHNALSHPSPNDSATYDGFQNIYLKRNVAIPCIPELDRLKKDCDGLREKMNAIKEKADQESGVGHLLFVFGSLPLVVGFFLLIGGLVCTILSLAKPDEFTQLSQPGLALLVSGGIFFVIGFSLLILSFIKGSTPKKRKEANAALVKLQQEKAAILAQAAALRSDPRLKPFNISVKVA